MINALLVVWREAFEAILVIGILFAALRRRSSEEARAGRKFIAIGLVAGLGLAMALAFALNAAETELEGAALEWFQTGMMIVAAGLILHMCLWMKKHGRTLKRELESSIGSAFDKGNLWGVAVVTALAVGREGMETVLFLYGMGMQAIEEGQVATLGLYAAAGLALAIGTGFVLARGLRFLDQKWFFRISTLVLMLLAGSLVIQATSRLIQADVLPALVPQVWNTAWLLDERSGLGKFIATLTGYQSEPSLMVVLCYVAYWAVYLVLSKLEGKAAAASIRPKEVFRAS